METMQTITGFYHVKHTLIEAQMYRCDKDYHEVVSVSIEGFKNGLKVQEVIDELTYTLGLFTHPQRAVMRKAIIGFRKK